MSPRKTMKIRLRLSYEKRVAIHKVYINFIRERVPFEEQFEHIRELALPIDEDDLEIAHWQSSTPEEFIETIERGVVRH